MEQSVRSDSTPVSAGHDTTGRHDPDRGRDAAIAKMLTGDAIAASTADPVFAVIDECRRLDALHDGFLEALAGEPEDHPEKANQHAAHHASWRCWRETVLTTVPQTVGGCRALASYAGAWFKMQGANDEDAETVLALIARSPMLPSPPPSSDLAEACVEQVKRLRHWDAHPGSLSEAEGDAEMDRWGAVTRRAIEEPSAGPRDLAGKACLSLHDMDRFLPERTHPDDLHRLLRVILREVMAAGGIGEHRQTIGSVVPQTPAGAGKAIVGLPSVAAVADPIFAAIDASMAAERTMSAFYDADPGPAGLAPTFFEEDKRLLDAQISAVNAALSTVPTTRAGQLALLDFLRLQMKEFGQADGGPPDDDSPIWRDSYHALFAALAAPIVGGQSPPEPAASAAAHMEQHEYALHRALTAHRAASRRQEDASKSADEVAVARAGGDASAEAIAPRQEAEAAAIEATFRAWRAIFEVRPRTLHQLSMMLAYIAQHFDAHSGMDDEPDVFGALIGAVNGLRISSEELTATHDLSLLSINELNHLADLCRHQSRVLAAFGTSHSERPLGVVLDAESTRLAILGDHARDEIDRRRPTDEFDRELRLETLIRADLAGNGYIEPALLAEAVAAWGTR